MMLRPVVDPITGEIILYDIFIDGKWIGSRSTITQCAERLRHLGMDLQNIVEKIIFSL